MDYVPDHEPRGGGLSIHDPILESDPKLRSLKRQVPIAIGAFVLGLAGSMLLLSLALSSQPVSAPMLVAAAALFVGPSGYFGYVTIALAVGAKRAHLAQHHELMAKIRNKP
jgi:hypothetical protein